MSIKNNINVNKVAYIILIVLLIYTGRQFRETHAPDNTAFAEMSIPNFNKTTTQTGVLKFENEEALIYIKPAVKALQGSHDPRFCWQGSGYEFTKINKTAIGEKEIYTAVLTKGTDRLHTAWWFDNGDIKTINEWEWRWTTLSKKSGFRLVNVTTVERNDVLSWAEKMLD